MTHANPRTVYVVRHANRQDFVDPDWVTTARCPEDPPLSADGVVQAQETARHLASRPIRHVFSSPFRRTLETAAPIAAALGRPLNVEPGLSEWYNPAWFPQPPRLLSPETQRAEFPIMAADYPGITQPTHPETEPEMFARTQLTTQQLLETFPGDLLVVGHGASVIGVTTALLGARPDELHTGYCCIIELVESVDEMGTRKWTLVADGRDRSHLSQPNSEIRFV